MKKDNMPEALGIFISLCGVMVMAGWFLDIGILKSILPVWVTMKFSTAFSFLLSGIILYFTARLHKGEDELAGLVLPIASMVIFLLMAALLGSTFWGVNVGIEEMFVKDSMNAVGSVTPGRPSIATMINFILIAMAGTAALFDFKKLSKMLMIDGVIVGLIGFTAVFGYILDQPALYFMVPGKSSAMAFHTAILFVFLGLGLVLTGRDR
jgi:hypothetical protein